MPDQLADSFESVDAAGNTTFNFTGVITALGLTLPYFEQTALNPPPSTQVIQWVDQTNGVSVAEIYSLDQGPGANRDRGRLVLDQIAQTSPADRSEAMLILGAGNTGPPAAAAISTILRDAAASITSKKLIDSSGLSDWLLNSDFGFARAHGSLTYSAADTNGRTYVPFSTLDFSGGGNSFASLSGGAINVTAGIYLILMNIYTLSAASGSTVGAWPVYNSVTIDTAAGTANADIKGASGPADMPSGMFGILTNFFSAAGTIKVQSWCSAGGTANCVCSLIRMPIP